MEKEVEDEAVEDEEVEDDGAPWWGGGAAAMGPSWESSCGIYHHFPRLHTRPVSLSADGTVEILVYVDEDGLKSLEVETMLKVGGTRKDRGQLDVPRTFGAP